MNQNPEIPNGSLDRVESDWRTRGMPWMRSPWQPWKKESTHLLPIFGSMNPEPPCLPDWLEAWTFFLAPTETRPLIGCPWSEWRHISAIRPNRERWRPFSFRVFSPNCSVVISRLLHVFYLWRSILKRKPKNRPVYLIDLKLGPFFLAPTETRPLIGCPWSEWRHISAIRPNQFNQKWLNRSHTKTRWRPSSTLSASENRFHLRKKLGKTR